MNRVLKTKEATITNRYSNSHTGVDIVGKGSTLDDIVAHSDGTVIFLQTGRKNQKGSTGNASYGNCIKLRHAGGYDTLYAHLATVNVKMGEKVKKGQVIGTMGDSGNAYGSHLHFEVFKNNRRVNPTPYLTRDFIETSSYYPIYKGNTTSIVDALKSISVNSSFENRTNIARNNGIENYRGTSSQNTALLNLLKQGKLKKG